MIYKILPSKPPNLLNRYSNGFIQSGNFNLEFNNQFYENFRSINSKGLLGENQVIYVQDSGLDINNCFFYDSNNSNHRKIAMYGVFADQYDTISGHGTHVCGIISGEASCTNCGASQYNGISPKSKISFADVGFSTNPNLLITITSAELYYMILNTNSSISSNSWGLDSSSSSLRTTYDYYSYVLPNVLFVFAAGNGYDNFKIVSPGDSKNVLTVGNIDQISSAKVETSRIYFLLNNSNKYLISVLSFGIDPWNYLLQSPIIPLNNLKTNLYDQNFNETLAIIQNNDCNLIYEVSNKSKFILLLNNSFNICNKIDSTILYSNDLNLLSIQNCSILIEPSLGYSSNLNIHSSSSKGPTARGFIKPDISAPGTKILSTYSAGSNTNNDHSCSPLKLVSLTGTSMSTPLISGAASLIYEYFQKGYYPYGEPNNSNLIFPLSTLIKSMLIISTIPLELNYFEPKDNYGYGYPVLSNILVFKDSNFGLRIIPNLNTTFKSHKKSFINVTNLNNPLKVCLSFLDLPLTATSILTFAFNMNLVVKSPNGTFYYGNHHYNNTEEFFSTIEKVVIPINELEIGIYDIHVFITNPYISYNNSFSMVVSGPFDHFDFNSNSKFLEFQDSNECILSNISCDEYNFLICNNNFTGLTCQKPIYLIQETQTFHLRPHEGFYFKINIPLSQIETNISFSLPSSSILNMFISNSSQIRNLFDSQYFFILSNTNFDYITINRNEISFIDSIYFYINFGFYLEDDIIINPNYKVINNLDDNNNNNNLLYIFGSVFVLITFSISIIYYFKFIKNKTIQSSDSDIPY